ncbi:MAG: EAL domain-containing protein, partial [Deltaproteobacteria bacterium]|nr:EAL domain-containing protein [Deltaproteobacteria bacterium]
TTSLIVPLFIQQNLMGLIALCHKEKLGLDTDRAIFVRQLADQTAAALGTARLYEENRSLAYFDALTGLANRRLYQDRLEQALILAGRRNGLVATCLLDLDGFKRFNDTLGHRVGDQLLRQVAERLLAKLRLTDAVARPSASDEEEIISRQGGDEYTFLLTQISDPHDAGRVARRVLDSIAEPFVVEGKEIYATATIGIAIYPANGEDAEALLLNAGTALSCAKERGRDHFQFYADSMNMEASRKLHLESRLRQALECGEIFLHYQPIRDAVTGDLTAAEALVRWDDPDMGLVPPDEFIPVAEETSAIGPLGLWVLRTACAQAQQWQDEGFRPLRISVNLSSRQLTDPSFVENVKRILAETGISPAHLEFEITESAIMGDDEASLSALPALRDLGIGLALAGQWRRCGTYVGDHRDGPRAGHSSCR